MKMTDNILIKIIINYFFNNIIILIYMSCKTNEYVPINNIDGYKDCMKCTTINNKYLALNENNNIYSTKKDYYDISNPPSGQWKIISNPPKASWTTQGMLLYNKQIHLISIIYYDGYLYASPTNTKNFIYRRIADTENRDWEFIQISIDFISKFWLSMAGWKDSSNTAVHGYGSHWIFGVDIVNNAVYRKNIDTGNIQLWPAAYCCVNFIQIYKNIIYGLGGPNYNHIYTWSIYGGPPWKLISNYKPMKYFIIKNDYIYGISLDNSVWKRTLDGVWNQIIGPERGLISISEYKNYLYGLGTDNLLYNCSINGGSWKSINMLGGKITELVISDNGIFYGLGMDKKTLFYKEYIDNKEGCKNFIYGIENILTCDKKNPNINDECRNFFNTFTVSSDIDCQNLGFKDCNEKKEGECVQQGYKNCLDKEFESSCKNDGYSNCKEKEDEEECKKQGYKSCNEKDKLLNNDNIVSTKQKTQNNTIIYVVCSIICCICCIILIVIIFYFMRSSRRPIIRHY